MLSAGQNGDPGLSICTFSHKRNGAIAGTPVEQQDPNTFARVVLGEDGVKTPEDVPLLVVGGKQDVDCRGPFGYHLRHAPTPTTEDSSS